MENHQQTGIIVPRQQPSQTLQTFTSDYESDTLQYTNWRDYWDILRKRKWLVLGVFLTSVITIGLYTFYQTPIYQSSAVIQILQDNPSALVSEKDPMATMMGIDTQGRFYETQYLILQSKALAARIMKALNLKERPEYKAMEKKFPKKTSYELQEIFLGKILKNLGVTPLKKSNLVEISYTSPDKDLTVEVPNAATREYLEFSMEARRQSYVLIRAWLNNELSQLATKVELSEKKVLKNGQEKNFLDLEGDDNVIVKKYVELNKVMTAAQADRAAKEAQYRQVKEKGADAPLITNNSLIQKLRGDLIGQQAKVSSMTKLFGKNYPQLQVEKAQQDEMRSRLNSEVQRSIASIKADYEAAQRTVNFLGEEAGKQKQEVEKLQSNLVQHHVYKRDLETNNQLFQALLARMKEASVASTMVASNVAVIQPAEPPLAPFKPNKSLNMGVAILIGLMGGLAAAFLAEYLDDSIKTNGEMERVCHIPSLGMVPLISTHKKRADLDETIRPALETFAQPMSMVGEAVHHTRTSLSLSMSGRPPSSLLVTSPNPNEGKTTFTVSLASAMLLGDTGSVVIVDSDMRKPSVHQIFDLPIQPGLSNFLTGSATITEIIRETLIPNLFIIPGGVRPPHPLNLLNSPAFSDLIEELGRRFQCVLLDSPPIIGFADARVCAKLVDGVILMIKHHSTPREAGKLAVQLLHQSGANILGGVLNMTQSEKLGYGGGYYSYYKYYHKYYDSYHE